jgi:uncharacterized protein (UPF0332 family)
LKRARKDLLAAEAMVLIDQTWSFAIAYHAILRAGRALVYSHGYLPTTKNSHKTITEFTKIILGDKYSDLILHFNRMRRKRHDFIYDSQNYTTESEARTAIRTAAELIGQIETRIIEKKSEDIFS